MSNKFCFVLIATFVLICAFCQAAWAGDWGQISTMEQYRQIMASQDKIVVLLSGPNCQTCRSIKDYWRKKMPSGGWIFIDWQFENYDYDQELYYELRALGYKSRPTKPTIIAKNIYSKTYFVGYDNCTARSPAAWDQSTPQTPSRPTLTEWMKKNL